MDQSEEKHNAAEANPKPKAGWSDADRRMLLITLMGTIAANIGTVLLVAIAIVLDRFLTKHPNLKGSNFAFWFPASVILYTAIVGWLYYQRRQKGLDIGETIFFWIFSVVWVILIVALIGYAAGVSSH
jgi:hypothetical protein